MGWCGWELEGAEGSVGAAALDRQRRADFEGREEPPALSLNPPFQDERMNLHVLLRAHRWTFFLCSPLSSSIRVRRLFSRRSCRSFDADLPCPHVH
jgi:hypothetical protein